ncbi:MAG: hypothetical protein AB1831_03760 [Pseudomonadota bacterium]
MTPRHAILALLLAGTLAAAFWPQPEEEEGSGVVVAVKRAARASAPAAVPAAPQATAEAARFPAGDAANLFPAQDFRPPPPPPSKPVPPPPPPPPMAPPVPFGFIGAWNENGAATVFLSSGDQVVSARAGALLPGGWRLDTVGADALTFTYVSLNQQRTLRIAP